ncbi:MULTISPECIES: hypothetical protein [Vibrio]|uniref:hypothetical protein n=1 Tax=Vibrio TaxID=662 RepID=UPI001F537723|nr:MULTISPECIES: hypothetical protein [Vibrio]
MNSRYAVSDTSDFSFPITVVEINFSIGGINIDFSNSGTQVMGANFSSSVMVRCGVGFCIQTGIQLQKNPKWKLRQRYDVQEENNIKVSFGK